MRSSYRRKRVNHVMHQAVIKKAENRKDKSPRKKEAYMRMWALIGAGVIMTVGLDRTQADTVYAAQYDCENKGYIQNNTLQEVISCGVLQNKGIGQNGDMLQSKDNTRSGNTWPGKEDTKGGSQKDVIQQEKGGSKQDGMPQDKGGGHNDDTPQDKGEGQNDDTPQDKGGRQDDDTPQDKGDRQDDDTPQDKGEGQNDDTLQDKDESRGDDTLSGTEHTEGDGKNDDMPRDEDDSRDKDAGQDKDEILDRDSGKPDDGKQDSPQGENRNGQSDEIVEEEENDSSEQSREKGKEKEKTGNRTRRNVSGQITKPDKTQKNAKSGMQMDSGHKTPKITWGTDTRILKMLRSIGRVQCGKAVIDASDLRSICAYITEKKYGLAGILMQLGTRFRQQPEGYTFDRNPEAAQEDIDLSQIEWQTLLRAAAESQNVPDGLPVLNPQAAMHIEGVEERTDYYETATEDNISRGKAAWADGRLLLGNGADNDKARSKGEKDGENGDVPEMFLPVYAASEGYVEIRHVHIGKKENKDGISGCYKNSHTTRQETFKCGAELKKTEATFYPNPDEPGGGTWHGGEYTCPNHGGLYKNPGTCDHHDTKTVTVWKHEIVCGLEDALFARLTVRGEDTDYSDRAICLEAVLEAGEGYEHLAWQEGDELLWTDETGNALGTGSRLMVYEAGVYRCTLNVVNADIEQKSAETDVRIIGLVTPGN